jgi:cytochrome c biogenesis protein CcmG, thiol:disulfide interchange protein DsbE
VISSTITEPPAAPNGSSRRPLIIAAVIAFLVIVLGVVSLFVNKSGTSSNSLISSTAQVGQPTPTFTLPNLMGPGTVGAPQNGGGKGIPAVLVFFASWCGPCQKEMPGLAAAVRDGEAGKASVIGIDGADNPTSAVAFVQRTGISFPVGADSAYAVTSGKFGFSGLPETVFVNGKGVVTLIHFGATTPAILRQGIKTMSAK